MMTKILIAVAALLVAASAAQAGSPAGGCPLLHILQPERIIVITSLFDGTCSVSSSDGAVISISRSQIPATRRLQITIKPTTNPPKDFRDNGAEFPPQWLNLE
jgi:hypothetical protein